MLLTTAESWVVLLVMWKTMCLSVRFPNSLMIMRNLLTQVNWSALKSVLPLLVATICWPSPMDSVMLIVE